MITVLCGGIGGSRFMRALASVVPQERLTAIVNTADDERFHGLYVSPDPDIVTYALAGEVDEQRGWGLRGDTFRWLESMQRFGRESWFRIGDRDLATHLHRTRMVQQGHTLSEAVASIAHAFGVRARLLPMSDDPVRTFVRADNGELPFQEYLVKRGAQDAVRDVRFDGVEAARPAPGVLEAIRGAEAIFIAPSNPIASIGPILAVPGMKATLTGTSVSRVAISPIIGGRSLQPPTSEMMQGLGHRIGVSAIAAIYAGLIDALVIDPVDAAGRADVEATGARAILAPALMHDDASRRTLARAALHAAGVSGV